MAVLNHYIKILFSYHSSCIEWAGHVTRIAEVRNARKILTCKSSKNLLLGRPLLDGGMILKWLQEDVVGWALGPSGGKCFGSVNRGEFF